MKKNIILSLLGILVFGPLELTAELPEVGIKDAVSSFSATVTFPSRQFGKGSFQERFQIVIKDGIVHHVARKRDFLKENGDKLLNVLEVNPSNSFHETIASGLKVEYPAKKDDLAALWFPFVEIARAPDSLKLPIISSKNLSVENQLFLIEKYGFGAGDAMKWWSYLETRPSRLQTRWYSFFQRRASSGFLKSFGKKETQSDQSLLKSVKQLLDPGAEISIYRYQDNGFPRRVVVYNGDVRVLEWYPESIAFGLEEKDYWLAPEGVKMVSVEQYFKHTDKILSKIIPLSYLEI